MIKKELQEVKIYSDEGYLSTNKKITKFVYNWFKK